MTMNTTWGYSEHDQAWKSDETLIHTLIDIVSKGGNLLLNIGPTPEGEFDPEAYELLEQIGNLYQHTLGSGIQPRYLSKLHGGNIQRRAMVRGRQERR